MIVWAVVGCGPATDGQDTGAADPPSDPIAEALAGCSSEADVVDLEGAPVASLSETWDANGDRLTTVGRSAGAIDWTDTYTYGAPHEPASWVRAFSGPGATASQGSTVTYSWEVGDQVREERDDGSDGSVNFVRIQTFGDDHQLSTWAFDYEGDSTIDDTADWAWTADEDGWLVLAAGEDPNGPYTITQTRDAELRRLTHHYSDSVGIEDDATYTGYGVIGLPTHFELVTRIDGQRVERRTQDYTFDDRGRPVQLVDVLTTYADGEPTTESGSDGTWVWSCP